MKKPSTAPKLAEANLEAVFETLDEGLVLANFEANVVHWNRAAVEMHGMVSSAEAERPLAEFVAVYQLEELGGRVLPYEEWPLPRTLAGDCVRGMQCRVRRLDRDNWVRIFVYSGSLIKDAAGKPTMAVLHVSDVTARRAAEASLEEADERMRRAQRVSRFGTFEIDIDETGKPVEPYFCSDQLLRIHGLPAGGNMVMLADMRARLHPEDPPTLERSRNTITPESPEYEGAYRLSTPAGEVRHIRVHAQGFFEGRRLVRVAGTAQDVTTEADALRELVELSASLERRVGERTGELAAVNAELESFAYAVSHDLRAPLRAIAGFSQAIVEDHGDELSTGAKSYLDEIVGASRKMGELIDALLLLSRYTRGELHKDTFDLGRVAERAFAVVVRDAPERRVTFTVEPGLLACGDIRLIENVLQNLLANALKYSSRKEEAIIAVHSEESEGKRYFCVTDNGAGFSMSYAAKLFQPFQRLHRQDEFPGIGIGLATVQRIVKRHGGTFMARGAIGQGATFGFWLPPEKSIRGPERSSVTGATPALSEN